MAALIEVIRDGSLARVWLNRPEAHNALGPELAQQLTDAFHALAHEAAVRVVVLGGRGPSFCAGADVAAMREAAAMSFDDNLTAAERLGGMFATVADFPKPIVGRIHGHALGGGVGLVCACDIPVAGASSRFGLTEVRLGILPALISPYVVRRIGDRHARELMLTGERIDAEAALRAGLVQHVVADADLDAKVEERVVALLAGGPEAQRRIKTQLELYNDSAWEEYRAALPRTLAEVRAGDEAREGLAAFLDRRRPAWRPPAD